MNSIRKWLYRPKKTDTSSLAQFYFADEELNLVAAELDSFDGRKDPERCTLLVNQLRACQDRVLNEIQKIMDDAIPGQRANRDFRVKFPDDVLQESLAGQLWFGAECLAAGSSILNREVESASMRPLARALTKNLDSLRCILRDQSLRNVTEYTERIQEALVIFDKLFAEFELSYVSAMVPVKTMKEYDMLQEVTVLFSETVQRALVKDLLFQEMIDDYDPALMFTIPRLAIVCGLLIYPEGPLNPDMDPTSMSEMYRPFQTLLFKIRLKICIECSKELSHRDGSFEYPQHMFWLRNKKNNFQSHTLIWRTDRELLYTLSANELNLLEKSLCSSEEPEVSTPALAHSEQLLQIDQGFDEGADHVPLEGIGSTILVHSANSGSPVTPVNQDLSDFLPNLTALSTPRGNFQFTDEESLSILNKSESQDSGLHSENVSTSDTITVDAVPLMTHDTAGAIGVVLPTVEDCDTSVESDTLGKDTLDSVEELTTSLDQLKWGNESNESACLKSCCRLESGGVSHMCRNILEEVVDDVVTLNNYGSSIDSKINSNGNEITRQFSWQYNVQFAIPQISVSDQEIGNHVDRDSFSSESTLSDLGSRDHFTDDVLDTLAQLSDARASEILSKSRSELDESTAVTPKCSSAVNETPRVTPMCSSAVNETSRVTPKCSSEAGTSAETICDSDTTSTSCDKHSPQNNPSDTLTGDSNMNTNGYSSKVASSSGAGTSTVSDPAASSSSVTLCEPASSSSVTELLDAGLQSVSSQTSYPNSHMRRKVSSKQRRQGSLERIHCKTGAQRTDSGDPPPEIPRIQRLRYTENVASGRHNNCDCDVEKDCNCTSSETSSYNSECNDEEEIALAIQAAELASRNEARSRFRSSSDLIHRLFVCIAGVADQLQTNYASDLRHILKCVFEMNSNNIDPDEEDVISKETETVQGQVTHSEGQGPSEDRLETDRSRASPPDRQSNGSGTEPPKWVPDEESTGCTSCKAPFTFVRRRHHCRNCGKIFCGRCSANSVPLPQYGHQRPVRVCNKCFMFQVTHFTVDD